MLWVHLNPREFEMTRRTLARMTERGFVSASSQHCLQQEQQ